MKKCVNKNNFSDNTMKVIIVLISTMFFIGYMIPMLYAYFTSDLFIYVNAWDEESYMTYQSALGDLKRPGYYFAALITLLFQLIGISGSIQNVLFDMILITAITFFIYKTLTHYKIESFYAFVFAIIILFSSVLFNYANPLLRDFFPVRHIHTLMFGYESYATILRTPNPQISYFLVIFAIYYFQMKSNRLILLLPLPFLYFYVAIPYFYFLIIFFYLATFTQTVNFKNILISSLFAYILIAVGIILMDKLFLQNTHIVLYTKEYYFRTHEVFVPLVSVVSLFFFSIQYKAYSIDNKKNSLTLLHLQTFILLGTFLLGNIQIISGYFLSYKNYYDYSFSILAGISISIFLYSMVNIFKNNFVKYIAMLAFLFPMLYIHLTSQGFQFSKMQFKIYMGEGTLPKNSIEKIIKDPTHALITSLDLRSKVAYALPHITIPPLSYQYRFPFIERQCTHNQHLFNNAMYYLKNNHPESLKYFTDEYKEYNKLKTLYKDKKQNTSSSCNKSLYSNTDFFLIPVDNQHIWHYFP